MFRDSRVNWSGLTADDRRRNARKHQDHDTVGRRRDRDRHGSRAGHAKSKKKLVVSFETPLAGNGSLPPEIDGFLAWLRGDATLKRHFPLIEVTGFRANAARQGVRPSASYSIVCLPSRRIRPKPAGR